MSIETLTLSKSRNGTVDCDCDCACETGTQSRELLIIGRAILKEFPSILPSIHIFVTEPEGVL